MEELIIVGGGAAGLLAGAVSASNNINTLILEHTDSIGKKILSTGNGKCNMTNYNLNADCYYCDDKSFIQTVLDSFGYDKLINLFNGFGMIIRQRDGYVYPYSEQASAVRDILMDACNAQGVRIEKNCNVISISKKDEVFFVDTDLGQYKAKNILIATGGKSFAKSGSDGSGYKLAKELGHTVTKTVPALTSLICHEKHYKQISGVRAKCKIQLFAEEQLISEDEGELQLTDYGISGIPVFNISRQAAYIIKSGKRPCAIIDFLKEHNEETIIEHFIKCKETYENRTVLEQLSYYINKKLATYFVKSNGISEEEKLKTFNREQLERLIFSIKNYKTYIANTKSFDFAQVTAGGVSISEINPATMESKKHKGLYFAGEIIDVDGRCGGYNLHFAWATAYLAAMGIANSN